MIELILGDRVISFDGKVIELFQTRGESLRFHIALIQRIEVEQRRRSHHIAIDYTSHSMPERIGIEESQVAHAQQLVAAVQQAMG